MKAELHMMRHMGMFGQIVSVDPNGKGMNFSMLQILISSQSEWVFMTRLVGKRSMFEVHLDNQVTLHVTKNEALMSNIRVSRKTNIGGIDGSQTGMSIVQELDILMLVWGSLMRMQLQTSSLSLSSLSLE